MYRWTTSRVTAPTDEMSFKRVQTLFNGQAGAGNYTMPLSLAHTGIYLVSVKAGPYSKIVRITSLQ